MQQYPIARVSGHLLAIFGEERWLLDTGSPVSFGRSRSLELDGQRFAIAREALGLDAVSLSALVGEPLSGLIGNDVLGCVDMEIHADAGCLRISSGSLDLDGHSFPLDEFMGVPVLEIESDEGTHSMFFDTGAQISYFQHEALGRYEAAGELLDFFPGMGEFTTDTYIVPFRLGPLALEFRCGRLPQLLGLSLSLAGVEGIIGNELCAGRRLGYFPRRGVMVLA